MLDEGMQFVRDYNLKENIYGINILNAIYLQYSRQTNATLKYVYASGREREE